MKKLLLFLLLSTGILYAQFSVGHISVNFKDAARTGGFAISGGINVGSSGRDVGTEVYYPSTSNGENTPVANGSFPIVVIGHGFVMTWDSYDNIYNYLAQKGYIVLLPRTEGGFSPNHTEFGNDLKFLATQGQALNATSVSGLTDFNGKVVQKAAIGGHSMGGGCSFLGGSTSTDIDCIFNFAAATTSPSSITAAASVNYPTLMFSGEKDCVVDTTVQNNHYTAITSGTKFHVILKDLTHCDFGNGTNFNCTLGQTTSGCASTVSNSVAFLTYINYLDPFLGRLLKDDCNDGDRFMDSINNPSASVVNIKYIGNIECTSSSIEGEVNSQIIVYPTTGFDLINIQVDNNQLNKNIYLKVFNSLGVIMEKKLINTQANIFSMDISSYAPGVYYLMFADGAQTYLKKIIKM